MDEIVAAVEQPKLIKPDLIAEIPGIDLESDYDKIIGPTPGPTRQPRGRADTDFAAQAVNARRVMSDGS